MTPGIFWVDLFLASRVGESWTKLDGLAVQTGAQTELGDLQVSQLVLGALIGLGVAGSGQPNLLLIIGIIILVVCLILFLTAVIWLFQEAGIEKNGCRLDLDNRIGMKCCRATLQ